MGAFAEIFAIHIARGHIPAAKPILINVPVSLRKPYIIKYLGIKINFFPFKISRTLQQYKYNPINKEDENNFSNF
jgi:hypothetical protein